MNSLPTYVNIIPLSISILDIMKWKYHCKIISRKMNYANKIIIGTSKQFTYNVQGPVRKPTLSLENL